MNISKELVDNLNAVIRIQITPDDYQPNIDRQLREYSKKVSMPGFRPGKVPAGMVKKMYGKSILVDELNKLTSDSLFNYIRENNLNILGNPLPKPENDNAIDLDNPGEINFAFEIGLAPDFNLDISSNHRFNLYTVKVDDKFVDESIEDYRKRLGEHTDVDDAASADMLHGVFVELDENNNPKEGGLEKHGDIVSADLEKFANADVFRSLAIGASADINLKEVIGDAGLIAKTLGISNDEAEQLDSKFRFTLESARKIVPAELNQDFFDRLLGPGEVSSEEELRKRIIADNEARYRKDAEMRLFNEAVEFLVKNTSFDLPEAFMKRWLLSNSEGRVKPEDIENNYQDYEKGIRWQLIESKILKDNNISFTSEDVVNKVTDEFLQYMGVGSGADESMRERAKEIALNMLKKESEMNRVYDRLYNEAMTALFLKSFDINTVELPFEKWLEQINAPIS